MKDMRAVRANEKLKRLSTLFGNGGLALVIAAVTRWHDRGIDVVSASWIFIASFIIWVAVQMNELLSLEDE